MVACVVWCLTVCLQGEKSFYNYLRNTSLSNKKELDTTVDIEKIIITKLLSQYNFGFKFITELSLKQIP